MFEKLVVREISENTSYRMEIEEGFSLWKTDRRQYGVAQLLHGTIRYEQEGVVHLAHAGHIVLLPRERPYRIQCMADCAYWIVNFTADELDDHLQIYPVAGGQSYTAHFEKLSHTEHPLRNLATLYTLFADLSAEQGWRGKKRPSFDIGPSVAYMQKNLADPTIQLWQIARESQISVVYFRKLFQQAYGQPPMQWLYAQRIQRAKELLASQDMRVAEVALQCGYSDIYSFSGAFKRAVGVSPMEYRKRFL